ncbi:response regulator transcription factor [Gloeobacter kilaueensis]|uniref:Two component transcriptional regulator, winged helix family n=1 Tax=Gloeobacter kilaueensis (strain ATCC BAA-2537 / CCAP 1431/1 / ULC 316 / JS1) TaxID=1183438 RepID=U5QGN1_GLOK1|nr:response regulator transcription factor [Gloeobacter kilaueensis]AGY58091.1 two component transcriptional regulator, winged helix family [Gloeobacter kilaueensis JS1]
MGGHILLVEDEPKLARFVELELLSEGYRVHLAPDGIAGLTAAREEPPDLILLDWELPGLSGLEVCCRLRKTGSRVPVIFLTGRDEVSDRVRGLDAGADDYLTKPFSIEELLARIRVRLRQQQPPTADPNVLSFEDVRLNRLTREVFRGERSVELTPKEFELLEYFLTHPRQVVTKSGILETVWGYDFMGDSNIIEVYVRNLRLKLEKEGEARLIQTLRGVGYILRVVPPLPGHE